MAQVVSSTAALLLLGVTVASAAGAQKLQLRNVSDLQPNSIYFFPVLDEKCGEGKQMYYGVVVPKKITSVKKIWMESMGGAICFNKQSCMDKEFNVWLDLLKTVKRYIRTPPMGLSYELFFGYLTNNRVDLDDFRNFGAGYFPNGDGAPLEGEVGYYYPSCTGDAGLGNYKVAYNQSMVIQHTGGAGFMMLLQAIQEEQSDLERITLIGASGSGVSRVAWAPAVADMFPSTNVTVLADSAMHVLPGTEVFQYFWSQVQWSPNPNGKHDLATLHVPNMNSLPTFDWRSPSAVSDMLRHYGGRVKVLYIGCNEDEVVLDDRVALTTYANLAVKTGVEEEMWHFLQMLARDAPAGCAFSYISNGTCHHQTRKGWMEAINAADPSDIGPQKFTEAFLKGELLEPAHAWCCGKEAAPTTSEVSSADSTMPSVFALALAAAWALFA